MHAADPYARTSSSNAAGIVVTWLRHGVMESFNEAVFKRDVDCNVARSANIIGTFTFAIVVG
jgi:hypothetical protein